MIKDCETNSMSVNTANQEEHILYAIPKEVADAQTKTVSTEAVETASANGMEPLTISSITILSSVGSENNLDRYVYNVPDGLEKNTEMIRAELLFYNTPQTEAISEDVYTSLLNVQEQCEVDYQKYCSSTGATAEFVNLQELANSMVPSFTMFMLSGGQRRSLAAKSGAGAQLINSFRSYYLPMMGNAIISSSLAQDVVKEVAHEKSNSGANGLVAQQVDSKNTVESLKTPSSVRSNIIVNGRLSKEGRRFADGHLMPNKRALRADHDHDHDHHHDHDHNNDPRQPPNGGGKYPGDQKDGAPIGPGGKKPYPPPPPAFRDEESDSDSDSEGEDEEGPHSRHRRHHGQNPWEDHSFPGALGFGAGGDMCIYDNVQSLSPGCVQAIGDVHALREQYWNDHVAHYHHQHPPLVLAFFAILGVVFLLKRCCYYKRHRAVKELLVGLNADPELKATVESRLGVLVPDVPKCAHAHGRRSCFAKVLTVLGVFIFSLISSFFITVTSLELTSAIVHNMDEHNPNGETTSPPVALSILFLICTAQVGLLSLVVYKIKKCYVRNQEQFAPSAPSSIPATVVGTGNNGENGTPGIRYVPMQFKNWIAPRISAVSAAFTSFGRRVTTSVNTPAGYAPLTGDETEMISVGSPEGNPAAHAPRYAVFTGVPFNVNQTTAMVPIQATPVTSVQFV